MMHTAQTTVQKIFYKDKEITKFDALIKNKVCKCINYNAISGEIIENDRVVINTTAIDLALGTGGYHFVICVLDTPSYSRFSEGHIMKLKYTPIQMNYLTAEAPESRFHSLFNTFTSLADMPVFVGSLHSMLAPVCIVLKSKYPERSITYIMSDSGAMPLAFSDSVRELREAGYLNHTITYGNAFGGDLECVNIYTALIAAREMQKSDICIVCMGPGNTGTDTAFGFSGIEQGQILDAVNTLNGKAIAIPRISFSEKRIRHYGMSHHTLTVLSKICKTKVSFAVPSFDLEKNTLLDAQIKQYNLNSLHNINYVDYLELDDVLCSNKKFLTKMKMEYEEDKEYFLSCAASVYLI